MKISDKSFKEDAICLFFLFFPGNQCEQHDGEHSEHGEHAESLSDGTARTNGRAWEGACECALRRAAPINPQVLGVLPRPEDFITGLVGLNRHEARVNELSDEQRRKILFGCDQSVL